MVKFKAFVYLFVVLCLAFFFIYRQEVIYGLGQAKGQVQIIWNTEKISELQKNPTTPKKWLEKFELIEEIKTFARDSLKLELGKNYSSFYDQKGKAILWNLTASPEFEIKAYQWKFPLIGSFPYKGFFDSSLAVQEKNKMDGLRYDTKIREVSAWSTLGIFNDPVLSSMFNRSVGKLAELIIHESTHSTVYLKDRAAFNENLASFIGRKGADLFLIQKYGAGSEERKKYLDQLQKSRIYRNYMQKAITKLNQSYRNMNPDLSLSEKRKLKAAWIDELKAGLAATAYFENDSIAQVRLAKYKPNNATFSTFSTYSNQQKQIELLYQNRFHKNLKQMINEAKENGLSLTI